MVMRRVRRFGYRPDLPDHRDRPLSVALTGPLPESVDLTHLLPRGACLDQERLGSCVANGISYACIMLDARNGDPFDPLSRLFLYWHARNQHGDKLRDSGTYIREAIKVQNRLGRVSETVYPYITTDLSSTRPRFTRKPGPDILEQAHDKRQASYERLADGSARKLAFMTSLASERPVVLGTQVGWEFVNYDGHTEGSMRTFNAPSSDDIAGGHCMCAVGYDPDGVIIAQSWRDWGLNGFARLSWKYILDPMTQDNWSIDLPRAA